MSQNPQTPANQLTDIFINYRRDDTASDAGRLEGDLNKHFPDRVFRDIHDIEAGSDYMEVINEQVGKCGALLVLIGRQWLTLIDKTGKRRLDNPQDPVVAEIAGALNRSNARVIPVLMQGAEMPDEDQLPEALKGLVKRNARKISDEYWSEDVAKLVKVLEKVCGSSPQPIANTAIAGRSNSGDATSGKSGVMKKAIIAAAAALIAVVALVILLSSPQSPTPQSQVSNSDLDERSQANVVAPANTAKQPDAAQPLTMQAVVKLSENEAEFFFPFDTTGDKWKWYLEKSKVGEDEYHWEVFVPDDYQISVYLEKGEDDTPGIGDFKALLSEHSSLVSKNSKLDDTATILPTAEPGGLRINVKGEGVTRMFANTKPKDVTFRTLTLEKEEESVRTIPVEYK